MFGINWTYSSDSDYSNGSGYVDGSNNNGDFNFQLVYQNNVNWQNITLSNYIGGVQKWQMATDPSFPSPVDIASNSATLASHLIGDISQTTYFRAVVVGCSTIFSDYVTISVVPPITITTFTAGGLVYNITSANTVEVGDQNGNSTVNVTIPSQVTYNSIVYAVTSISDAAFHSCYSLTSVTIPSSVTSIGSSAFNSCSSLASVSIPDSVTSIGTAAFYGCSGLTSVICYKTAVLGLDVNVFEYVNQAACSLKVPAGSVADYQAADVWKDFSPISCITTENPTTVTACGTYTWANNSQTYTATGIYTGTTTNCITEKLDLTITTPPSSFTSGGINYEVTSSTTVAVGLNAGASGDIIIPTSVTTDCGTYAVTSIGDSAFLNRNGLTSVTIPNSVTVIGDSAFQGCSGLTMLTIPNSVTSIGAASFYGCSGLTSATISNSMTSISANAFTNCSGFTSITIPDSVTSIGSAAFQSCSNLTIFDISNSVTTISDSTFNGCTSLTSITIPDTVTRIGSNAFQGCSGLTTITIPNSVTSIGAAAFYNCIGLTSIIIPNLVTSIGQIAFSGCSGLTSVSIGNSVTSILDSAFSGCSGLTSVICNINTPIVVNANVFQGVNQASCSLTVPAASVATYQGAAVWQNFSPITCANPTENITTVSACGTYTWANNSQTYTTSGVYTGLTENCVTEKLDLTITTPPTSFSSGGINYVITSVTTVAVGNNSGATGAIDIPASVTTACGTYSVTSINSYAFASCSNLISVTISNSVTSIGDGAFTNCSRLTSVTIPNSVTSIGSSAFSNCKKLTSVTVPNAVTSIDSYTFFNCSSLLSVIIPSSVTSIGNSAFGYCTILSSVTIPTSVTSVGTNSFASCKGLTSVTIPNSVTSIGDAAFFGCSNLSSVSIPDSLTSISTSIFYGCSILSSVTIPSSITSIGNNAFYECASLTSVTIPNSVTSIGAAAFQSCSSLTSVTIPDSINYIGDSAFSGCSGLTSVICNITTPIVVNANVFQGVNQASCSLIVPAASVASYEAAAVWQNFSPILCANPTENTTTLSACDSYTWENNGQTYTTSGVYTGTTADCVTEILDLTINVTPIPLASPNFNVAMNDSNCSSSGLYILNGTLNGKNSYDWSLSNFGKIIFDGTKWIIYWANTSNVLFSNSTSTTGLLPPLTGWVRFNCTGDVTITPETQTQTFCSGATVANLDATGTDLKWYNVASGGTALATATVLSSVDYFVSQTINGCESARTPIAVILTPLTENVTTLSACETYTWANNGETYTTSGVYTGTTTNCVIEKLDLTIIDPTANFSFEGINYVVTSSTTVAVGNNAGASGDLIIPASVTTDCGTYAVTSISSSAFFECDNLTSVTIPNSVTSIGSNAFEKCSSLQSVTIPDSIISINDGVFKGCYSLTSVTIPNTVTSIGNSAFQTCIGLTSVTIPNSITSIGQYAFSDCSGLTSVTIPNSVTSLFDGAFANCSSLTSVTIGNAVTSIGNSAFSSTGLTSITIPNSATNIGNNAFQGCGSLASILIPNSVTSIGDFSFADCTSLRSVVCYVETPLIVHPNVIENLNLATISLAVPAASIADYQLADVWENFNPIASTIPSTMSFCKLTKVAAAVGTSTLKFYYTLTGGTAVAGTITLAQRQYFATQELNGIESSPRVPVAITLIALPATITTVTASDTALCKYIGTTNTVTYTATPGANSYVWTVPAGVTIINGQGTNVLTVDFHTATTAVVGTVGRIGVRAVNASGCASITERIIVLSTILPTAPSSATLTYNGVVQKIGGDFIGDASKALVLEAIDNSTMANHYTWELPAGVSVVSGDPTTDKRILIHLGGVTLGNTALVFKVYSVAGCGTSVGRSLVLRRYLPGTPTALALTNDAISPINSISNVSAYTGKFNTIPLTLTATPNTRSDAEATSYKWVLPSGIGIVDLSAAFVSENSGFKTYTSISNAIKINLSGVGTATSLLLQVFGVYGNGESRLSRNLTLRSAIPAKPGTLTTASGSTPTYHPTCSIITVRVPNVFGVTYTWSVKGGAMATIPSTNTNGNEATINVSQLPSALNSSFKIGVVASNGTGSSSETIYTIKLGSACSVGKIKANDDNTAKVTNEFKVIAYPNPSSNVFTIKIQSLDKAKTELSVYDTAGRLVEKLQAQANEVDLGSKYPAGVYNLIVKQGENVKTVRVLKK